jgi:RAD51-like protein 2
LPASQALFASISTSAKFPLTQSAASLTAQADKFSSHCPPIDKLMSGGLTRGHILEISGPPGTMKEAVGVGVVRSFLEINEEVLFVGGLIDPFVTMEHLVEDEADTQNMTRPQTLVRVLDGTIIRVRDPMLFISKAGLPSLPTNYKSLIRHIDINALPDFMIFIHNLASYLDAHVNVSYSTAFLSHFHC